MNFVIPFQKLETTGIVEDAEMDLSLSDPPPGRASIEEFDSIQRLKMYLLNICGWVSQNKIRLGGNVQGITKRI